MHINFAENVVKFLPAVADDDDADVVDRTVELTCDFTGVFVCFGF